MCVDRNRFIGITLKTGVTEFNNQINIGLTISKNSMEQLEA